jgi:hypothetical protein
MKYLLTLLLLVCSAAASFAQNTVNSTFFGAGWNNISPGGSPTQPNPWCPQDSAGTIATLSGFRLWDDGAKWSQVETTASTPTDTTGYTFTKLDWAMGSNVATKTGCVMRMLYQFGDTPQYAAAGLPTGCAGTFPYGCSPPADLNGDGTGADAWFMNYVGQVALRYDGKSGSKGHMKYWGTWNEADSPNFWCITSGSPCGGSTASLKNLVLMAWDMYNLTKCIDSTTLVVSPDGHVGTMPTWFHNFVNTTISAPARNITLTPPSGSSYSGITCSWSAAPTVHGYQTFDIVDEHMRGAPSAPCSSGGNTDPINVICAYNAAAKEMTVTDPVLSSYPLWNDEWGWNGIAGGGCQIPNVATAAAYIVINMALQVSFSNPSIQQEYFYQWDNSCVAPPTQTIVGLGFDVFAGWAIGSTFNNFSVAGTVYKIPGTFSGGAAFQIMFDDGKTCSGSTISTCVTASQSAGSFTHYTDIAGAVHTVSGGVVPVGLAPIILTGSSGGTVAATPTFSPNGGTFTANQSVTISSTSVGAIKCWNTTGSPATNGTTGCTPGSTLYAGPITVSVNETVFAVAGGSGFTDSSVGSAAFAFHGSAPTFSPNGGTFTGAQTLTLSNAQSLSMIFTTNGSTPSSDGAGHVANGTAYSGPFSVAATETVKAIGYQNGWTDSSVGSASFTINYNLTANVSGTGSVSSSPIGINTCTTSCSALFGQGTVVTLTATPGPGFMFSGWSGGGCAGTGTCVVTLNSTTSVTATFSVIVPVFVTGQPVGVML